MSFRTVIDGYKNVTRVELPKFDYNNNSIHEFLAAQASLIGKIDENPEIITSKEWIDYCNSNRELVLDVIQKFENVDIRLMPTIVYTKKLKTSVALNVFNLIYVNIDDKTDEKIIISRAHEIGHWLLEHHNEQHKKPLTREMEAWYVAFLSLINMGIGKGIILDQGLKSIFTYVDDKSKSSMKFWTITMISMYDDAVKTAKVPKSKRKDYMNKFIVRMRNEYRSFSMERKAEMTPAQEARERSRRRPKTAYDTNLVFKKVRYLNERRPVTIFVDTNRNKLIIFGCVNEAAVWTNNRYTIVSGDNVMDWNPEWNKKYSIVDMRNP